MQMTKKARLLNYLKTHKRGITGHDALLKLGLYRLSGEIHHFGFDVMSLVTKLMNLAR